VLPLAASAYQENIAKAGASPLKRKRRQPDAA